jgi:hypothetical protein
VASSESVSGMSGLLVIAPLKHHSRTRAKREKVLSRV